MKQFYGMSQTGNLKEALSGLDKPRLILLFSNADQFSAHVAELQTFFPNVPSIGCSGMSYSTRVTEKGVGIIAFTGDISVAVNVLESASTMPVKYSDRLERDLVQVKAAAKDTVCINLCTGNDASVLTTMYSVLGRQNISLTGGTVDAGKVSVKSSIFEDIDNMVSQITPLARELEKKKCFA